MGFLLARQVVGSAGRGHDRAVVLGSSQRIVLGVFDGAGGTARGAHAAETLCKALAERADEPGLDTVEFLSECDLVMAREPSSGQTTAVVAIVDDRGVRGASVGDSGAWLVMPTSWVDLTQHQIRKPLIGAGSATPTPFGCGPLAGTLLIATDGLLKYADRSRLSQLLLSAELQAIPDNLIASVRLRSGALQDDVAIIVCRSA